MSRASKRGSTFSNDAQHDCELCLDCALPCFGYLAFRLPTNACLKEAIKKNSSDVIDLASRFVRLPRLLACIGLSSSRFYDWKNAQDCGLDDFSSCPRSLPGQMTATERSEMRSMVQSEDYRHLSVGSIARLASRLGKVYACTSTWYRAIQNGNWTDSVNASIHLSRASACEPRNRTSIGMLTRR